MTNTAATRKPGDIHTWDYQADVFGGQYRLVADLGKGVWEIEHLEPSDETLDAIQRLATDDADRERTISDRIADTGTHTTIRFVSAARYAEAF